MSHITVQQLRELRQRTGAGMLDCRQALEHAGGDIDQATTHLRQQAAAEAAKLESDYDTARLRTLIENHGRA